MTTPLPCPFCGSAAKLIRRNIGNGAGPQWLKWFVCGNCECGCGLSLGEFSDEKALEKWNTRKGEVKE